MRLSGPAMNSPCGGLGLLDNAWFAVRGVWAAVAAGNPPGPHIRSIQIASGAEAPGTREMKRASALPGMPVSGSVPIRR